jgi:hypothetical protein
MKRRREKGRRQRRSSERGEGKPLGWHPQEFGDIVFATGMRRRQEALEASKHECRHTRYHERKC